MAKPYLPGWRVERLPRSLRPPQSNGNSCTALPESVLLREPPPFRPLPAKPGFWTSDRPLRSYASFGGQALRAAEVLALYQKRSGAVHAVEVAKVVAPERF